MNVTKSSSIIELLFGEEIIKRHWLVHVIQLFHTEFLYFKLRVQFKILNFNYYFAQTEFKQKLLKF